MGRTATHVANKYGYTIFARCDAEKKPLEGFASSSTSGRVASMKGAGLQVSAMSAQTDVNIYMEGFTKIVSGDFVKFDVDCRGRNTVYISIYAVVNNRLEVICDNLPKREDYSVIVTESGQVVDTKYGTIWTRK